MEEVEMLPSWAGRVRHDPVDDFVDPVEDLIDTVEVSVDPAKIRRTSVPGATKGRRRLRGRSLVLLLLFVILSVAAGVLAAYVFTAVAVL